MPAPPAEMGGMPDEQVLQQLAMALEELGVKPEELAAAAQPGPKMAAAVQNFKRSGKFQFEPAAKQSADRTVRNYLKSFIQETCRR